MTAESRFLFELCDTGAGAPQRDVAPASRALIPAIPQSAGDGRAGYIDHVTVKGHTMPDYTEAVRVGTAVVAITYNESANANSANDATPQQKSPTVSHLSDVEVGRLKVAEGIS